MKERINETPNFVFFRYSNESDVATQKLKSNIRLDLKVKLRDKGAARDLITDHNRNFCFKISCWSKNVDSCDLKIFVGIKIEL